MDKLIKLTDGVGETDPVYYVRLNEIFGVVRGYYEWDRFVYVKGVRGGLSIDKESFEKVKRLLEDLSETE